MSLIYGEIAEDATFRFLSAGHAFPAVFSSQHDRFMEVAPDLRISFPPLGMLPSLDVIDRNTTTSTLGFKDHYEMNKWLLMGAGDILLLHTDGLAEHIRGDTRNTPRHGSKRWSARSKQSRARDLRGGQGRSARVQPAGRRHQPGGHQTRTRIVSDEKVRNSSDQPGRCRR